MDATQTILSSVFLFYLARFLSFAPVLLQTPAPKFEANLPCVATTPRCHPEARERAAGE